MAFALGLAQPLLAQPSFGTLVGPDGDIINYECSAGGLSASANPAERVTCDFVQVMLNATLEVSDFEAQMQDMLAALSSDQSWIDEFCAQTIIPMASIVRLANGRALEDRPDLVLPADITDRAEFIRIFNSDIDFQTDFFLTGETFCQQRTEASAREFFAIGMVRNTRTCRPMVNRYQQTFVKVSETLWAVESQPEPPCAIVNTSRFTMPESGLGTLWEYVAEKRILNPVGEALPGLKCSDLDEEAYLYSWQTPPVRVDCEFMD